jgi:hypothetical protein
VRADGRAPPARTALGAVAAVTLTFKTCSCSCLLDPASGRTGALVQAFTALTRPGWCDPSGRLQSLFG